MAPKKPTTKKKKRTANKHAITGATKKKTAKKTTKKRRIYLERVRGTSLLRWEASVRGKVLRRRYGRIGDEPAPLRETAFETSQAAVAAFDAALEKKRRDGYVVAKSPATFGDAVRRKERLLKKETKKKITKKKTTKKKTTKKKAKRTPKKATKRTPKKRTPKKRTPKKRARKGVRNATGTIGKGSTVEILRGEGLGVVAEVFWEGPNKFGSGRRFGVKELWGGGQVYWVDEDRVRFFGRAKKKKPRKSKGPTFKTGTNHAAMVLGRRAELHEHKVSELLTIQKRAEALGRKAGMPLIFAAGDILNPDEPGTMHSEGVVGILLALGTDKEPTVFSADVLQTYTLKDIPASFYEALESKGVSFDVSTSYAPAAGLFLVAVNWSQAGLSVGTSGSGRRLSVSNEDNTYREIDSKLRRAIIRSGSGVLEASYC